MKILIVDNLTMNSEYLKELLKEHEVDVRIYTELDQGGVEGYDLYILSGARNNYIGTVFQAWDKLKLERDLILETDKPIIGICYGCELIAAVYGSKVEFSDHKISGNYEITFSKDIGFDLDRSYTVYGNHLLNVTQLGDDLELIASSKDAPEIIRHKSKPIYGLQFHPEKEAETTDGDEIFLRLIELT